MMIPSRRHVAAAVSALLAATALVLGAVPGALPPAGAAARVTVENVNGDAVVDPTFATTITLEGRGFQSIKGGHGGIYVLFGVVKGSWKPSAGGGSGRDYLTVPDAQATSNAGYARFVAFPESDTAGSANGGTIAADGSWSARLTVPGGTFSTVDADQKVVKVDCRTSTCGVITIGAHGVSNANNETFTPVRVARIAGAGSRSATSNGTSGAVAPGTSPGATSGTATNLGAVAAVPGAPAIAAQPKLEVDRASAKPGKVLSFSAVGLQPGIQVSATFDDGAAAVGPMTVGANGQVAGVLTLPTGLATGTYELRIVGGQAQPSVQFAVVAATVEGPGADDGDPWPVVFVVASAVVLAGAVLFAGLQVRRRRAR